MSREKVIIVKDTRSIRKKPWIVRWYGEYDPASGKQKRYSKSFRTKAQAENFQAQKQGEFDQGELRDAQNITLSELSKEFTKSRKHILRPSTLANYQITINQLLDYFSSSCLINTISRQRAEQFISSRKIVHPDHLKSGKQLSAWGRNSHQKNSHAIFNAALDWGYLKINPFDKIKPVKAAKRQWHYFTAEEFQSLLGKTSEFRLECLYAVMYGCGLRIGEALNLLWNGRDIDFAGNRIHVKNRRATSKIPPFHIKDHEDRSIPLPQWLSNMLIELQNQSNPGCPFVFLTSARWERVQEKWANMRKTGKSAQWQNRDLCNNVLRNFQVHCQMAGISTDEKLTLHCLRKSYAQNLADHGTPIATLKKLMGHSSIRTTEEFYLRSTDANEERAREVMEEVFAAGEKGL